MAAGDVLSQRLRDARARDAGNVRDERALSAAPERDADERAARATSTATRTSPLGEMLGFSHDAARTGRFFAVGAALHGPFFHFAFRALERAVGPGTRAATVAKKVAIGHGVLFPTYTVGFFYAMSVLEGKGLEHGTRRLEAQFADAFAAGTMFWPFANAVNFAFVPSRFRLLYLNLAGVAWNAFLSHLVNDESRDAATGASASMAADGGGAAVVVASARESVTR